MLKLKRLKIHKFPRVKPGTELVFNDGFNVILGVNGSGKTTLLKLLTYLISGDLQALGESEFHLEYELQDGHNSCTFSIHYFPSARMGGAPTRNATRSELTLRGPGDTFTVTLVDDIAEATYNGIAESYALPSGSFSLQPRFHTGLTAQLLAHAPIFFYPTDRLDESTRWLEGTTDSASVETSQPYLGYANPIASSFERFVLEQLRGSSEQDVHHLDADRLPFLRAVMPALACTSASLLFDLKHKERSEPHELFTYTFGDFRFRLVKADGTRLRHHDLSYGQQRLLAFHFYAAMHPHVIIADELTNGLHHAMIDQCLDLIGDRQAFLATQNPLLLDNLGFTSAEEVRSTFILCNTEQENGREQMVWRNTTVDEAENFYRDYKVGISHVNDILRSWGLW